MQSLEGHPADAKGCIKTPSHMEDLVFAPEQAARACQARGVTLWRMDNELALQAESLEQHGLRDVKQKGLRIPKV